MHSNKIQLVLVRSKSHNSVVRFYIYLQALCIQFFHFIFVCKKNILKLRINNKFYMPYARQTTHKNGNKK